MAKLNEGLVSRFLTKQNLNKDVSKIVLGGKILGKVVPERQIRWNRTEGSQNYLDDLMTKMYFLLINQPREIETIQEKIFSFYKIISEKVDLFESQIPKSDGLHYLCFSFETPNGNFTPNHKIYAGKNNQELLKIFYDSKLKIVSGQDEKALFYLQKYVDEKICKIIR